MKNVEEWVVDENKHLTSPRSLTNEIPLIYLSSAFFNPNNTIFSVDKRNSTLEEWIGIRVEAPTRFRNGALGNACGVK